MSRIKIGQVRTSLAFICLALPLAACGGPSTQPMDNVPESGAIFTSPLAMEDQSMQRAATQKLRSDPDCIGAASENLKSTIERILDRFNHLHASDALGKVEFVDSTEAADSANVAVLACRSGEASAFSLGSTAVVSVGLISLLKEYAEYGEHDLGEESGLLFESALSFIIYHELGHIFLGHSENASGGALNGTICCPMEIQADIFAAQAQKQAGYSLNGPNLVFDILEKSNPGGTPAHPVTQLRSAMIRTTM